MIDIELKVNYLLNYGIHNSMSYCVKNRCPNGRMVDRWPVGCEFAHLLYGICKIAKRSYSILEGEKNLVQIKGPAGWNAVRLRGAHNPVPNLPHPFVKSD